MTTSYNQCYVNILLTLEIITLMNSPRAGYTTGYRTLGMIWRIIHGGHPVRFGSIVYVNLNHRPKFNNA